MRKRKQNGPQEHWQPVTKVCFDGVARKFKPRGYDCAHYKAGYGGVKCAAYPNDPKRGCPCQKAPWRCKYFTLKDQSA